MLKVLPRAGGERQLALLCSLEPRDSSMLGRGWLWYREQPSHESLELPGSLFPFPSSWTAPALPTCSLGAFADCLAALARLLTPLPSA